MQFSEGWTHQKKVVLQKQDFDHVWLEEGVGASVGRGEGSRYQEDCGLCNTQKGSFGERESQLARH